MWVASRIDNDGISIFWQRRAEFKDGMIYYFDYNGNIDKSVKYASSETEESMLLAGIIPVTNDIENFCKQEQIEEMINRIGIHAVKLTCCGYGDTPDELISYLADYSNMFIVNGKYIIKNGIGLFDGIDGEIINIERSDAVFRATIDMVGDVFEIDITRENVFDFLSSTFPL